MKWLIMTGIVAHTYPEWWLKLAGQVAHWSTDYSDVCFEFRNKKKDHFEKVTNIVTWKEV